MARAPREVRTLNLSTQCIQNLTHSKTTRSLELFSHQHCTTATPQWLGSISTHRRLTQTPPRTDAYSPNPHTHTHPLSTMQLGRPTFWYSIKLLHRKRGVCIIYLYTRHESSHTTDPHIHHPLASPHQLPPPATQDTHPQRHDALNWKEAPTQPPKAWARDVATPVNSTHLQSPHQHAHEACNCRDEPRLAYIPKRPGPPAQAAPSPSVLPVLDSGMTPSMSYLLVYRH
jgi:hypothetical protein